MRYKYETNDGYTTPVYMLYVAGNDAPPTDQTYHYFLTLDPLGRPTVRIAAGNGIVAGEMGGRLLYERNDNDDVPSIRYRDQYFMGQDPCSGDAEY